MIDTGDLFPHWGNEHSLVLEENMGKQDYVIESDFEDLHGNRDEAPDLELDISDSDNPIIKAALADEDWVPPEDDDEDESGDEEEDTDEDDDDEDDSDEDSDEDDDEEESDESDDEDDEDEDEKYSRKVQKRIDRERDARRRDKVEADRKLAHMERRLKYRDAKDEYAQEEREDEVKLRKLKKKKVEALEEGETTTVVDIDDEILDIKANRKAKQLELKQQKDGLDTDDDISDDSGTPDAGKRWLERHPQFHTNQTFRNVTLQADKMVAARGLDRNTEKYYEEMEKILKPQFPEIIKTVKVRTKKRKTLKKKRSAVGPTSKSGVRRSGKKRSPRGRIRLTKADQQQMEIFGLDPTNPVDAKAWAAEKGS